MICPNSLNCHGLQFVQCISSTSKLQNEAQPLIHKTRLVLPPDRFLKDPLVLLAEKEAQDGPRLRHSIVATANDEAFLMTLVVDGIPVVVVSLRLESPRKSLITRHSALRLAQHFAVCVCVLSVSLGLCLSSRRV